MDELIGLKMTTLSTKHLKYYLYRHVTPDYKRVLYVGIGTKRNQNNFYTQKQEYARAYNNHARNRHWKNAVKKYGYEVEIMMESNDLDFIKDKEREFIKMWRLMLTNVTEGGEGAEGRVWSVESRNKIRQSQLGGKNSYARKVYDIKTGEVYNSIKEASKDSKYTYQSLIGCLCGKRPNRSDFRYVEDVSPTIIATKVIRCKNTGRIFQNQADAAEHFGVSRATICNTLKGKHASRKQINIEYETQ